MKAEQAAGSLKNYAFELKLEQVLTGEDGAVESSVTVNTQGHVELAPLKLDQTVQGIMDGEAYSNRTIVVPDAYFMYEPEFEEWSKTPKDRMSELVRTLSDFQVNPAKALQSIRALGNGLKAEMSQDRATIKFEGNGTEAAAFLLYILASTLDLSDMEPRVRDSIKVKSLKLELSLDAARHWPLSYRIDTVMTMEYEAGKTSTLTQTLSGSYGKHDAAGAVVVPDEAMEAPELDIP